MFNYQSQNFRIREQKLEFILAGEKQARIQKGMQNQGRDAFAEQTTKLPLVQPDLGSTEPSSRGTHHDGVVMGTAKAQHHPGSGIALQPAQGEQHLLLVPHPADVILQAGVLRDVVEAGRHWHVNHRAGLAGIAWKRKEQSV